MRTVQITIPEAQFKILQQRAIAACQSVPDLAGEVLRNWLAAPEEDLADLIADLESESDLDTLYQAYYATSEAASDLAVVRQMREPQRRALIVSEE
jgi:hypothetical protein